MVDMIGKEIAGYEIIKQGKEAVIGVKETNPSPYVAWHYNQETGSCFWGRYCTTLEGAEEAFDKKERGEYSGG